MGFGLSSPGGDVTIVNEGGGSAAWDPIETAVADNATVTMVQPGAAYVIPRKSGNNRALLDCTDLLASPGVPALIVGASLGESTSTGTTTYGPSVYVPVDQPAWIADLAGLFAAITVTDYTGSPVDLVFTSPAVTVTLDTDYTDATGVALEIVAQLNAAQPCTVVQLPQIVSATGGPYLAALRSTAAGDAVTWAFNAGASDAGELATWFTGATYIDGWSAYPVGLGGRNVGTGELGALTTTHLWTDDTDMDYVHYAEIVSLDGETIQATSYKLRPGSISYTPSTEANWPEYDFGDTPANFNLDQALDILAARGVADIVRSNASGTTVAAGAAAGSSPTVTLVAGNDAAGAVGITVGSSPTTGTLATVTFDTEYPGLAIPIVMPSDPDAAAVTDVYALPVGTGPTTGFTIRAETALTEAVHYEWAYHVIGLPA